MTLERDWSQSNMTVTLYYKEKSHMQIHRQRKRKLVTKETMMCLQVKDQEGWTEVTRSYQEVWKDPSLEPL